jgi:carotenoid cleavage dioxygenase-like enzyme
MASDEKNHHLLGTSRNELSGPLHIIEGAVPEGLTGAFYCMYQAGSVNSNGLPFPETHSDKSYNHEYGSPIMNGDGMCVAVFFDADGPSVKTSLMKTPCYYADEATRWGAEHHKLMGFRNFGITRMSLMLGSRNFLNTAVVPVQFAYQKSPGLIATYDVGRPFAINPRNLELVTPVGKNKEWLNAQPAKVPWPFGVVQSSAHPMFDPHTSELFTVNYIRESGSHVLHEKTVVHLKEDHKTFKQKLEELASRLLHSNELEHVKDQVAHFFHNLDVELSGKGEKTNPVSGECEVHLWRWDGENSPQKWLLQDQDGNPLNIKECMHQMGITEHYIILTDCSFKFSIDLLLNNPFPESEKIDRFMRWLLSYPMVPYTTTYLVRRSDLNHSSGTITAYKVDKPIPIETIHYSCNYDDSDGRVTLYGLHNTAVCVAEWLRSYDINYLTGKPLDNEVVSLFAIGSMDLSRMGKWVIDTDKMALLEDESKEFCSAGNLKSDQLGPNTWSLSLYAHRGLTDAREVNDKIKYIWFVSTGTDSRMLSEFIFNLYEKYPNRQLPVEDLVQATKMNLPFCLQRLNTESWAVDQIYQADPLVYLRSVQFIPHEPSRPGIDPQMDGFIMLTVQIGDKDSDGQVTYRTEFWVFDALDIEKGPILKMMHPDVLFCFSLHSTWLPKATHTDWKYRVDIIEDYNEVIDGLPELDKIFVKDFFYKHVYPHFLPNLLLTR